MLSDSSSELRRVRRLAIAVLAVLAFATAVPPAWAVPTDAQEDAAELAARSPADRALLDQAMQAYAQHQDARGDEAVAGLIMNGFDATGLTAGWLHSGDTMTPKQRRTVADLYCEAGAPCPFGPPKPTDPERDLVGVPTAQALTLIEVQAGPHRLILLGEMHGTREIPPLVGHLVRSYAKQGPVVLGVEIDATQAKPLDTYLDSDGSAAARAALLADRYWHKPADQSDGRRNLDLIDMIEYLRALKAEGSEVSILPFDNPPSGSIDTQARDKAMAGRIRAAFQALPSGRLLVLSGKVHAMLAKPGYAPPEMQDPMGSYLRDLDPWSVDIAAQAGEFWACAGTTFGPTAVTGVYRESGRVDDGTFNLRVVLPKFSVARLIEP